MLELIDSWIKRKVDEKFEKIGLGGSSPPYDKSNLENELNNETKGAANMIQKVDKLDSSIKTYTSDVNTLITQLITEIERLRRHIRKLKFSIEVEKLKRKVELSNKTDEEKKDLIKLMNARLEYMEQIS